MSEPVIKCESVYKIFGENAETMLKEANGNVDAKTFQENGCIVGVNNASFEVSKGEMLVVMGLSGSGKSTLLRCISRLTDATGGKIFIEGQDLLNLNNKELIDLRKNKMSEVYLLVLYMEILKFDPKTNSDSKGVLQLIILKLGLVFYQEIHLAANKFHSHLNEENK